MDSASFATTAAIVANGTIHNFINIGSQINAFPFVVAVDGGLNSCKKMGVIPDLIIGDMDSISSEVLQQYSHVEQKRFPIDKDKTDLELAIEKVISLKVEKIVVFGALEKRIDHSIYTLHMLRRYPGKVIVESEYETVFVIEGETKIDSRVGQTISLIALGEPAIGITTQGLKWELHDATFDKNFMSVSNVCLSHSIRVSIQSGDLLCCLRK